MECNICGGTKFIDHNKRTSIKCTNCGSIERTRVLAMYIDKYLELRPGLKILHFAPERQLFPRVAKAVGETYEICDIDIERYAKYKHTSISIKNFDLCTDCETLPDDHYDVILHNHVMEHLPCNITAVLYHLHRSLAPDGLHMFSVPIIGKRYEVSFLEMEADERTRRFRQSDHLRNFARIDLPVTIGMLFEIDDILNNTLVDIFGEEALERHNIPKSRWNSFNGACLFMLTKDRLKLKPAASELCR